MTSIHKKIVLFFALVLIAASSQAAYILIPMDQSQKNHLKAYGITYWISVMVDKWGDPNGGSVIEFAPGQEDKSREAVDELASCQFIPGFADGAPAKMKYIEFMTGSYIGRN